MYNFASIVVKKTRKSWTCQQIQFRAFRRKMLSSLNKNSCSAQPLSFAQKLRTFEKSRSELAQLANFEECDNLQQCFLCALSPLSIVVRWTRGQNKINMLQMHFIYLFDFASLHKIHGIPRSVEVALEIIRKFSETILNHRTSRNAKFICAIIHFKSDDVFRTFPSIWKCLILPSWIIHILESYIYCIKDVLN